MSSMSTGPDDQINIDRDYESERGSAWNWALPLIALVVVAALLWALFGTRSATYPSTSGASSTVVSTPATGSGAGLSGSSGTTGMSGSTGSSTQSGSPATTGGSGTYNSGGASSGGTTSGTSGTTSGTSGGTTGRTTP